MRLPPLSPPEERLLRALWSRGSASASSKADAESAERLVAGGWIELVDAGRKPGAARYVLTEAGRQLVSRLPVAKPTLADIARSLCALQLDVEELRAEIAAMRQEGRVGASPHAPGGNDSEPTENLSRIVREAWRAVDQAGGFAGLVPVPALRDELGRRGLRGRQVDEALLTLEDRYEIDLKIANDPSRVARAEDALHEPDRGLLYYVVMR